MYLSSHNILFLAVFFTAAFAAIPDPCWKSLNGGVLDTDYYVTPARPFASSYACNPSITNVAQSAIAITFTAALGAEGAMPSCGEIISQQEVSFGYYECEMKVSRAPGTITTCQVASTTRSNYESVYIKFFGNETNKVFIGYYASGRSNPTGPVALTFDASEDKHKYGFEWTSGYVRWYVDGREVSSALGGKPIPRTPNHFYASLLTEAKGVATDDSLLPTDAFVNRVFSGIIVDKTGAPDVLNTGSPTSIFTNISYTPTIDISCDPGNAILPGGNGYAAFDPANCERKLPTTIYDNVLAKGWATTGSTILDLKSSYPRRTGNAAIRWDVLPMTARLYLLSENTFDSSLYYNVEFWINGGGVFGQQIGINMLFDGGDPSTIRVNIGDVLDEGVQPNDWSRVVIPFSLFGVNQNSSRAVKGFVLSSISSSYGGRVGIDDIRLGYELPMCADIVKVFYNDDIASQLGPNSKYKAVNSDRSWGKNYDIKSTKFAHSGSSSIELGLYDSSGINLRTENIQTNEYQGISFWINTAFMQGWDWTVYVTSPSGDATNNMRLGLPLTLNRYYGGPIPQQQDQWSYIIIPFYQFGITSNSRINGIVFSYNNPSVYQGFLYIDDIQYARSEEPKASTSNAASLGAGLVGIIVVITALVF